MRLLNLCPPDERCTGLLQRQLNHPPTGEHDDVMLLAILKYCQSYCKQWDIEVYKYNSCGFTV